MRLQVVMQLRAVAFSRRGWARAPAVWAHPRTSRPGLSPATSSSPGSRSEGSRWRRNSSVLPMPATGRETARSIACRVRPAPTASPPRHAFEQERSRPPRLAGADPRDPLDRDGQQQRPDREHEPRLPEPEVQPDHAHQRRVLHGGGEPAEDRAADQVGPAAAAVELVELGLRPAPPARPASGSAPRAGSPASAVRG